MTTSSTSTLARLPFKQPRQTTSKAEVVIDRPNEAEVTEVIMKGPYQISNNYVMVPKARRKVFFAY